MRAMRAIYMRAVLPLLMATTLVAVFASGASAAPQGSVTPPPHGPCLNTVMQLYDTGYGGGFSNSLGAQVSVIVQLYQQWDPAAQVWCGGFQTMASFEIDPTLPFEVCDAYNVKTQVRQYRNGASSSLNGPTISDCDVWHNSNFVPGLPDASSGTFYGWANFTSIDSTAATTSTHTQ